MLACQFQRRLMTEDYMIHDPNDLMITWLHIFPSLHQLRLGLQCTCRPHTQQNNKPHHPNRKTRATKNKSTEGNASK